MTDHAKKNRKTNFHKAAISHPTANTAAIPRHHRTLKSLALFALTAIKTLSTNTNWKSTIGKPHLPLTILYLLTTHCALSQELPEYQVKAAFICNFAKFIEWPTNTFAQTNSPIIIGIFGDNPFTTGQSTNQDYLATTAAKIGPIAGHPLEVRKITFTADLKNCHILYLSTTIKRSDLPGLLKGLRGILTVSDIPGFTREGGIIALVNDGNRIRFEINPQAAGQAGLKVSSKLLMLAKKPPQAKETIPDQNLLCAIFP